MKHRSSVIESALRVGGHASAPGHRTALDAAYAMIQNGKFGKGMTTLAVGLGTIRSALERQEWEYFCRLTAFAHPLRRLLHQDPFTLHSFSQPKGYPGDAKLLDFIYGHLVPPAGTTEIGAGIFTFTTNTGAPQSVRGRRDILAKMIDETAARVPSPQILSIACGHLREAGLSAAVLGGTIGEFIALDQDAESLAHVERTFKGLNVKPVNHSVRNILSEKVRFHDLDFVYAAGLYDYLSDRVATKLTRLMFNMLAPGGRMLVANFAPSLRDIGYMESYMNWKLIYRTLEGMAVLSKGIPAGHVKDHRVFLDDCQNIVFLEMSKK